DRKDIRLGCTSYIEAQKHYYVDKTLMIREMITDNGLPQGGFVKLILRPRGSGKSLNMDMLRTYFEKTAEDTSVYFRDKKIWQCSEGIRGRQGSAPVIFISFNDVSSGTWDEAYSAIKDIIAAEYMRHSEVLEGLDEDDSTDFYSIMDGTADWTDYSFSLISLCRYLHGYYGVSPIMLIDDYDRPIQTAPDKRVGQDAGDFIGALLGLSMKGNPDMAFGVITGTEWLPAIVGLNNLAEYTIHDWRFADSFGFTREEVYSLLSYYGQETHMDEICRLYGGHMTELAEIYRPADVLEYVRGLIKTG
ncbi:MAG: AAA family ATPase, partial [Clostridia bacterium]|nr:AAA family ATPase [Clostridia bacterium]